MRPKGPAAERPDLRPKVTRPDEAETLVSSALTALDALEPLIAQETEFFRAGRVREALALAMAKNEAAQSYTRCLEVLKSNAIAIGRFQPASLTSLRERHEAFARLMSLNMAVVSTARTVSEGLMRDLADTLGQNASPKTYLRGGITHRKAGTTPLALSKAV
ncbi:MAG: hypothetical protein MUF11_00235 [Beijerinckiaceae bacterium]|jgi:hypothetical protein|nr:hypothetical protein [Beijerinckiaceae bacterium]